VVVVTVEEYGDYQCPPCGLLHPEMKKIELEYGPRINFVFRNLPLPQIHKNALLAAKAAEAARLQNRFWEMHDRLYETQNAWKDEGDPRLIFTHYARELGLDTERFAQDMDGIDVQRRLTEDKQQADSLGIEGTPTVLIEGRQLKFESTTGEGIRKGIDLMLARKAAGK
jgi:protein-disulfide isomerase